MLDGEEQVEEEGGGGGDQDQDEEETRVSAELCGTLASILM